MTDTEELSTFPYSNFYPYRIYHLSYHVVYPPPSDDDPLKQLINSPLLAHVLGHISDIRESKDKKSKNVFLISYNTWKKKSPKKNVFVLTFFHVVIIGIIPLTEKEVDRKEGKGRRCCLELIKFLAALQI